MLLTSAQIKPKSFESRRTLFFLTGVDESHVYVRAKARARLLPQSYQCPNLSEGADLVAGQLRGDKELSLIHISEPTRLQGIAYAVFWL